ncbi:MAG: hypothetical protein L0Y78_10290 [candidate division NC10 bacterium]|nr:hypothetical protein [candidate division NC10 bacterium]
MEENVQREVETLKGMVLRWKRDYLESAPSDGGGEFLAQDFLEEIDSYVYPYVRRIYECNHLSGSEAKEFLDFCYDQVEELRNSLREAEGKELHMEEGGHA